MNRLLYILTFFLFMKAMIVHGQTTDTIPKKLKLPSGHAPPTMPDRESKLKDSIETQKQIDRVNQILDNTKASLRKGDITGYYGWEVIAKGNQVDSCLIRFNTDSTFTRNAMFLLPDSGSFYQPSGFYDIKNDTIVVSYFCRCGNKNSARGICCDRQKYVLTKSRKLKLIGLQYWDAGDFYTNAPPPKGYKTITLLKCNTTKYAGKYSYGREEGANDYGGSLIVYPETDSTVLFFIDIYSGNLGQAYNRLLVKNGKGIFESKTSGCCKWQVVFDVGKLTISTLDKCYDCGFGGSVFADHNYKRMDSIVPEFFIDGHGHKIFFSKTTPENYLR